MGVIPFLDGVVPVCGKMPTTFLHGTSCFVGCKGKMPTTFLHGTISHLFVGRGKKKADHLGDFPKGIPITWLWAHVLQSAQAAAASGGVGRLSGTAGVLSHHFHQLHSKTPTQNGTTQTCDRGHWICF